MLHAVQPCIYFELETSGEEIICAQSENIIVIELKLTKKKQNRTKQNKTKNKNAEVFTKLVHIYTCD